MVEVQAAWPIGGDSRFVFRKNFAKYELFKSSPVSVGGGELWAVGHHDPQAGHSVPDSFFPQHSLFPEKMVSSCLDTQTGISHEDLIQVRGHPHFMSQSQFPRIPLLLGL